MSLSKPVSYPFPWTPPLEIPEQWRHLRQQPILEVCLPSGDTALLVTRCADVKALFSDTRLSRNTARHPDSARISANNQLFGDANIDSDPPRYLAERSVVTRAFTARRIESLRPKVWEIANDLMDQLAAGPRPADLVSAYAFPLPIRVICHLLGVPTRDRDKFVGMVNGFMSITRLPAEEVESCRTGLSTYLTELIEAKRDHPGEDLTSHLVRISDEDQNTLSAYQLRHWVQTLLIAGYVTTATQIGVSMAMLLHRPHIVKEIQADLSLVPSAVEELMRYQVMGSSIGSLRYALEDIELSDGSVVPKGATVMLSVESNMDESVFPDPYTIDIRRKENNHLSFGSGIHYCAGAALARMELQVTYEGLLTRLPNLTLAVPGAQLRRAEGGFINGFTEVPVQW
ncbi:cytochrome [Actinosynnema sp. ALI-1.44]|uniref:cytochrome P450 n=1 Tax=Actinosynnema sp. ALI-1.44 TaxID=1933779 RepID=UPI00097C5918|nr:cytochrome P450 [Actinosynnema sp. ALI-1.44]ONI77920.1 cytochrome [Actinosynnema sp. ALI-1.44]